MAKEEKFLCEEKAILFGYKSKFLDLTMNFLLQI